MVVAQWARLCIISDMSKENKSWFPTRMVYLDNGICNTVKVYHSGWKPWKLKRVKAVMRTVLHLFHGQGGLRQWSEGFSFTSVLQDTGQCVGHLSQLYCELFSCNVKQLVSQVMFRCTSSKDGYSVTGRVSCCKCFDLRDPKFRTSFVRFEQGQIEKIPVFEDLTGSEEKRL